MPLDGKPQAPRKVAKVVTLNCVGCCQVQLIRVGKELASSSMVVEGAKILPRIGSARPRATHRYYRVLVPGCTRLNRLRDGPVALARLLHVGCSRR